jgi:tetratricopeptide (TPR) repeat protein
MSKALASALLLCIVGAPDAPQAPAVFRPTPSTHVAATADCEATAALALKLLGEFELKLSSSDRQLSQDVLQRAIQRNQTEADGYSAFAAGTFVQGQFEPAAWGALKAATLNWNSRQLVNVGAALMSLKRLDEAESFVACAALKNPQSPFVVEARGMLAHRWNDCANATRFLELAVRALPRDMNVRYSAAVIHHQCGNAARAKSLMYEALDMAPTDEAVVEALKVIDPAGTSPKSAQVPDEVRKQIEECFRFMDTMVALADAEAKLNQQITKGNDLVSGNRAKELREGVAKDKAALLQQEESISKASPGPYAWNELLRSAIDRYGHALSGYFVVANDNQMGEVRIIAASLRMSPVLLEEKVADTGTTGSSNYLMQNERAHYSTVASVARETLGNCGRKYVGNEHTRRLAPCGQAYCETITPAYSAFVRNVQSNENAATRNFPRAAADFAAYWQAYANQAADYTKRTFAVMKFRKGATPSTGYDVETALQLVKAGFHSNIGLGVIRATQIEIQSTQERLADAWNDSKDAVRGELEIDCAAGEPTKDPTLTDEINQLLAALKESGEFESKLENPDCEVEIGAFKLSCKPWGFESVKATIDVGGVKIRADLDRWGVIASEGTVGEDDGIGIGAGPFTADARGSKVFLGKTEVGGDLDGPRIKVGASAWIERDATGRQTAFVQAQSKVGIGVEAKGLGKAGCDFYTASAKFNLREFGEALRK